MAEEEEERVVLTQELVASSLSQVARTIDGASFAFTKLDLAGRSLSDIGTVLAAYEHLRYINLSKNRIADAASLIHIKSLLALNLRQNALQRMPPFANPYLQVLDVAKNQLTSIAGIAATALTMLNLDDNQLSALDGVGALKALEKLEARRNAITSLKGLGTCAQLKELYIEENKVDDLSPLVPLQSLTRVVASANLVKELAPVASLKAVREVVLRGNAVETLEQVKVLAASATLRVLDLTDNPVCEVDNFRQEVLLLMPRLVRLNGEKVTRAELEECRAVAKERKEEEEARAREAAGEGKEAGEGEAEDDGEED